MRQKMFGFILALAGYLLGGSVWATTMIQLDTESLYRRADTVLVGRVALPPRSVRDSDGRVYSRITILVEDYVKVPAARQSVQQLEIVQLGGTHNGITTMVPGMPIFQQNERMVLFLRRNAQTQRFGVVGLSQGKYNIQRDPTTGRDIVIQSSSGASVIPIEKPEQRVGFNTSLLTQKASGEPTDEGQGSMAEVKFLDDFVRELKAYDDPDSLDRVLIPRR